jgi:hypothetical protein
MKHRYLFRWQFTIILLSFVVGGCTTLPPSLPPSSSVSVATPTLECPLFVISGRIINLDQVGSVLSHVSYLQLVSVPTHAAASGLPLPVRFFPDQTAAISSDLARITIPPDGVFGFQVSNLEPGSYLVAVQRVRGTRSNNAYYTPMLLTTNGSNIPVVPVMQGVHFACRWDMGNVMISESP